MIVSPRWLSRWERQSASQWAAWRESIRAAIYPSGNLVTGADAIDVDWSPTPWPRPLGCSRMDRYRFDQWGGRTCSLPCYTWLCHPTATPVGTCLIWCCGHVPPIAYYTSGAGYDEGVSIVEAALALGWHVVLVGMPLFDFSTTAIGTMSIPVSGTPTAFSSHAFVALESDGGPHPQRLYIDHALRSANQVDDDLAPTRWILGGHSGGAVISPAIGVCDSRFASCWYFSGGQPTLEIGNVVGVAEWEQHARNSTYLQSPVTYDHFRLAMLSCAVPGRVGAMMMGSTDAYFSWTATQAPVVRDAGNACRDCLAQIGADFSLFTDTGPHEITQARADYMFARIP